ncbi:CHAT domain-containing protein [Xylanimonas ulmi]|uniref:CHAT domain-containing protein n=1 Tax=Xylanimonas ulmi TaxID=228973 RepID=A0A4Q7M6K4_9MICO|nr:CHAT domain-containing protein [Xylanibacterium ulmi]RZS63131.1 CHAT domain-containing protein [Xylanibacterium ulmi]
MVEALERSWWGIAHGHGDGRDLAAALAALDADERRCAREGRSDELQAVRGRRGLLLLSAGRLDEALAALGAVVPRPGADPSVELGVVLLHRGALRVERGRVEAAIGDLTLAVSYGQRLRHAGLTALARHSLGYALYLQGDLPRALREMSAAAGGLDEAVTLLDRARVLAAAGLVGDAVAVLSSAVARGESEGADVALVAETRLELARCLLDAQEHERARAAAHAAAAAFTRVGNVAWALRAQVVELEALLGADRWTRTRAPRATLRRRAAAAARLAAAGDTGVVGRMTVTYPALLAAAEWSTLAGDLAGARRDLDGVPADLTTAPLAVRVARAAVVARLAYASGERGAGVRAVRQGQRVLAAHRGLGSVEAVAASGVLAMRLNLVDLEAARATGDGAAVFDALERGRATAAGAARVVPPDDPELAALLGQARSEQRAATALGTSTAPEAARARRQHLVQVRRLQAAARERSWQVEGQRRLVQPTTARSLRAALRRADEEAGAPVVASYVAMAGSVFVVRLDARGQSLRRLAPLDEVSELAQRAHADLTVVANTLIPAALRDVAHASLARTLARLDALLVAPLEVEGRLHVAARGRLLTLPWSTLPSRVGRCTWVGDRVDVRSGGRARPGGVVVLAGPGTDGAVGEAAAVAARWPGARLLRGAQATTTAALDAFGRAAVVHLAAHGGHVPDNAMFSSLRLADGPLYAHELDGVDLTGAVVVLSACELGRSTLDVGGEALGFASVLLRHGASAVVAAVAPLRDEAAVRVMPRLHAALREGLRPAAALAAATAPEPEPAPLVCFGPLAL